MVGSLIESPALPGVPTAAGIMHGPRIAAMRCLRHIFWLVVTKSRSLSALSTIPYLAVSMLLPSAADGPVASPT